MKIRLQSPEARRLVLWGLLLASAALVGLAPRMGLADQADDEFMSRLYARGYYDLAELQYKDWLADEKLPAEERIRKTQGLIALYTALATQSADQRDRKKYQQLANEQVEQLKKQKIPPVLAMRLDLDAAQLQLDEVRTMGTIPPPKINEEGETVVSPVEKAWASVLATYVKVSKAAGAALADLIRSKKTGADVTAAQTQLEGLILEAGLRGAWARYYYTLALPAGNEQRAKLLKDACGTFEMTAASYPDKDLRYECILGSALCIKEMGKKDKALSLLDDVGGNSPNQNQVRAALYNKAVMLFEAKQYEEALRAADGAVKVVTRTPDADLERASLYMKAKIGYALAAAKSGALADKLRAEAERAATTVAQGGGKWAPMAQDLIVSAGAGSAEGASFEALVRAEKLFGQQKWAEAAKVFEDFIAKKPEGASKSVVANAHLRLGLCYYSMNSFAQAGEAFKAVMDASPDQSLAARAAYFMAAARGMAFAQSKKPEDQAAYVDALAVVEKRFPNHEQMDNVEFRLGAVLHASGKVAEAAEKYRKVREGAKDYREAQHQAGICDTALLAEKWKNKAKDEETKPLVASAVRSLKAASAPADEGDAAGQAAAADAAIRLARLHLADTVNKPQESLDALKDFEKKYTAQDAAVGDALFLRFWSYEKLGNLDEAWKALQAAAAKQPASPQIAPAFETLAVDYDNTAQKAKGPEAKELRNKAVVLLEGYLNQVGNSASQVGYDRLLMRRAYAYSQLGRWDKAAADYEALYKRYPGALNINKSLAGAYAQIGKYAEALKLYQDLEEGTERYSPDWWEARYNVALMFLKMGEPDNMVRAIEAVRILRDDLGGKDMKKKFDELLKQAPKK